MTTAATEPPTSALEISLEAERSKNKFSNYPEYLVDLTLQILHNLQYQHRWTDLKIHTKAPASGKSFPRPLISGLPPKRLYVHPDEQAQILKDESRAREQRRTLSSDGDAEVSALEEPVVEWVLPTHLKEKWSLRQFAEVFDGMDRESEGEVKEWDEHKRVVLAILQDDSTVVYYVRFWGLYKHSRYVANYTARS
jgi:tRNA-splicing endonuclease subunit Sen15